MDSHLWHDLVEHNVCTHTVGMPNWNNPITYKRHTGSRDKNMKDVLAQISYNGGSNSRGMQVVTEMVAIKILCGGIGQRKNNCTW